MSFLSSAFSGASNNFTPAGSAQAIAQSATANQNYGQANTGLNTLIQQLQQQSTGGGPNLANAQLQSATGQNVANQAALMAGQRGASANPALIARQAAMQGANIQQQAAGQASQNRLAQQLSTQGQLASTLGTQGSLANNNYSISQGATNSANQIGSQEAGQNAQMNQGLIGGAANAIGSITGLFADGGSVGNDQAFGNIGQGSNFGFNFTSMKPASNPNSTPQATLDQMNAQIPSGSMDVMESPQPMMMTAGPDQSMMQHVAQGGPILPFQPVNLRRGGPVQARVPQEKATISGNSLKNDKIPAMVSEGEIVIPRDVAMSPNAPTLAAQFVAKVKRK